MPDAAPQPSAPAPTQETSPPAQDAPPSQAEAAPPEPAGGGALFRALVDAGAEPMAAYTADQRIRTMVSEAVPPQLQPFLAEMRQLFADQDRKLDVLTARVDGLKVLVHITLGALALLVTALIAVFGLLFTT